MDEQKIARISVTWRGRQLDVDADSSCTVKEFGQLLQDLTNVKPETLKLIVPQSANKGSKLISPFSDPHSSLTLKEAAISEGKPIRMMGVFEDEIEEVSDNGKRPDMRIIGFEEEEQRLRDLKVDFILLAGYLKLIPGELVQAFPRSMLNIHPSLLPAFGGKGYYGLKVHKAVIASGARYSGPTVHFVDEQFDTGKTLAQRVVPVLANDTPEQLAARVLHEEHQVYVEAVAALCGDRIVWRDDGVPLIRSQTNPNAYT